MNPASWLLAALALTGWSTWLLAVRGNRHLMANLKEACASISPDRRSICDRPKGHDGYHAGPQMPTVTLDEPYVRDGLS